MAKHRKWLLFTPLILGLLLILAYGALWMRGAERIRRSIETWAIEQREAGIDVRYDDIDTRGFPFFLRAAIINASISGQEDWRWRAPRLFIDALPLSPNRLVFSARASHSIEFAADRWTVAAPDSRASIARDRKRQWILDFESGPAEIARLNNAQTAGADSILLTVAPAQERHETIEASLAITNLAMKHSASNVIARSVEAMIAVRRAPLLEEGIEPWRMAGGALELRRVSVETEEGKLTLAGELTLDAEGRPEGVLNAEIVNPGGFARALGEAGLVSREDAETAAASLTLAAIASGGVLTAPLVLNDGVAMIAGVAIADLPSIE